MSRYRLILFFYIAILIQVFALPSCAVFSTVNSVSGRYSAGDGTNYSELILNPDGSSFYNAWLDIGGSYHLQGKWSLSHHKVLLTKHHFTLEKNLQNSLKDTIIENFLKQEYKIIYVYNAKDSSALFLASVKVNNDYNTAPTVIEGYTVLPNMPIKNIEASWLDYKKKFNVKNPLSNSFIVYLSLNPAETDYIIHDIPVKRWAARKNKLICADTICKFNKSILIRQTASN